MIVVDASALLELLLRTRAGHRVESRLLVESETLHAPHIIDLEVAQVLRRYAAAGVIDTRRGSQTLQLLADLPLTRHAHQLLLPRIWELRHNVTAYDAAYLALAEALGATLVTRDARLASFGRLRTLVELL